MIRRKGMLNVEFMVSVLVFLSALSFVIFTVLNAVPRAHQASADQDLKSIVFQVSDILLRDEGEPRDWHTGSFSAVQRIGLSNGTLHSLHDQKILSFVSRCGTDYLHVKELLGVDFRNDVVVDFRPLGSTLPSRCAPPSLSTIRPTATITRFAMVANEIYLVQVSIV